MDRGSIVPAFRRIAIGVALLASASCGSDGPFSPISKRWQLDAARERWFDHEPPTYQYSVRRMCECISSLHLRVTVVNGAVTSMQPVGGGPEVSAEMRTFYGPIPALFAIVSEKLDGELYWMRAEYDPEFGFPVNVFFDYYGSMADEEWGLSVSDFAVPTPVGTIPDVRLEGAIPSVDQRAKQ